MFILYIISYIFLTVCNYWILCYISYKFDKKKNKKTFTEYKKEIEFYDSNITEIIFSAVWPIGLPMAIIFIIIYYLIKLFNIPFKYLFYIYK